MGSLIGRLQKTQEILQELTIEETDIQGNAIQESIIKESITQESTTQKFKVKRTKFKDKRTKFKVERTKLKVKKLITKCNVCRNVSGFYKRRMRCVRRCLKKVLRNARLTYEELLTLLIQIEGVLNSRPLTYVDEEENEPLTPSHLVTGRRILSIPSEPPDVGKCEVEKSVIVKRNRYLITILGHFWKRWSSEYLTQLREHHRSNKRDGPVINVVDVVTVKEDNVKRLNWQMALVDEVIKGKDGKSRAAIIRIMDKASMITRLKRPVQKLFPVELKTEMPKEP